MNIVSKSIQIKASCLPLVSLTTVSINIVFNDSIIPSSLQTDHLGHVIGPAIGHEDINSLCNDFMLRMNFLLSNFKHCSHDVKYRLVKSYCMAFMVTCYLIYPVRISTICMSHGESVSVNF